MGDVIKVGDSICCNDYNDMMCVMNELMQQGYTATAEVGYVVRIQSVPIKDEIEADEFITRI